MRRVIMHFVYTTVISGAHESVLYKHDGAKMKIKGEGLFEELFEWLFIIFWGSYWNRSQQVLRIYESDIPPNLMIRNKRILVRYNKNHVNPYP